MSGMNHENWQDRLRMGQSKPRTFTPGEVVHYGDMTASLINESQLLGAIGNLEELKQQNPAMHQQLMQLCGTAATLEIGEVSGLIPKGTANETYRKLADLLDNCMAINPRFEDKSLEDIRHQAASMALEFKEVCQREIADKKNGIIATALRDGLSQVKSESDIIATVNR